MLIDQTRDPVIFLRTHAEAPISLEEQFERFLTRTEPFVLVTDHVEKDHEGETQAERKQKAIFFKRIRDRLRLLCRGMIVMDAEADPSLAARLAAQGASKALGFPVAFAAGEEQAMAEAMTLLRVGRPVFGEKG